MVQNAVIGIGVYSTHSLVTLFLRRALLAARMLRSRLGDVRVFELAALGQELGACSVVLVDATSPRFNGRAAMAPPPEKRSACRGGQAS